jgi:hypothetical protein
MCAGVAGLALAAGAWAPMANARGVDVCRVGQMRLSLGPRVSEKTEQETITVTITNLAARSCQIDGYPTVRLFHQRQRLPFVYRHHGDQMITHARPELIVVNPRSSAYFALNKIACGAFTTTYAQTLRVTLPGSRVSPRLANLRQARNIDYCPGHRTFTTVSLSPIVPTRGAAFRNN